MSTAPRSLLLGWLERQLPPEAWSWLRMQADTVRTDKSSRALNLAISLVSRKVGKADLELSASDLRQANEARRDWTPVGWSTDQAARVALLLTASLSRECFVPTLKQLAATSDVGELIAFYRGLPLYPNQSGCVAWAAQGTRTNIKAVFDAIALNNPFASEQFNENSWNQMVLKAVFIGSPLHRIVGLDARRNPNLRRMLCDYAHERWAAGRDLTPELWRCVGPYADTAAMDDLRKVLETGDPLEQEAAALALRESPDGAEDEILKNHPALLKRIAAKELSWDRIYRTLYE